MNIDRPKIVLLYQSLLGIYGDHGNAVVLTKRLQWRGIDAELLIVEPGQPVPTDGAVYLLGAERTPPRSPPYKSSKLMAGCSPPSTTAQCFLQCAPATRSAESPSPLGPVMRSSKG